jgi:hypothetical protein
MSDQVAAPAAAQPAAPAVSALPVTAEHVDAIKKGLTGSLNAMYNEFTNAIKKFPINPGLMQMGFSHLDTGLIWIEKAISLIESLPLSAPVEAAAQAAGAVVGEVEKVAEVVAPAPAAAQPEAPDAA